MIAGINYPWTIFQGRTNYGCDSIRLVLRLAFGEPKARSWQVGLISRMGLSERCPTVRSDDSESKAVAMFSRRWHRRRMAFVYVLRCADGTFYVGQTTDLLARFREHQSGLGAAHVNKRLPVELVYAEQHHDTNAALKRERQLKRWSHRKKAALICGDISALKTF